MTPNCSFSKRR